MAAQPDRQTLAPLAAAVRSGALSAVELVDESLRRAAAAADLGAVVTTRAAHARAEARDTDRRIGSGDETGSLGGLPVLVKDNEAVSGLRTTFGSRSRAAAGLEAADGLIASILRRAGAIVVGKTNLPEFAFEGYTDNLLFGATANPWHSASSPGGSSGGSGAALAAGLAPIATATDVGGSIRIPAALCGLVGLKPTSGLIALDPALVAPAINSHGPLTTTTADARLLFDLLVAESPGTAATSHHAADGPGRLSRLIVSQRLVGGPPLSVALASAFQAAVRTLREAIGGSLEAVDPPRIFPRGYDPRDWFRIVGLAQLKALGPGALDDVDSFDPMFAASMRDAASVDAEEHDDAVRRCRRYRDDLDRLLGHDGVLLSPTLTVEGWSPDGRLPGQDAVGLPGWVYNTEPPNLTGHPAISVPGGLLPDGRPFGLQLVGPRSSDHLLLDLAAAFERAAPWLLAAPGYTPFAIDTIGIAVDRRSPAT